MLHAQNISADEQKKIWTFIKFLMIPIVRVGVSSLYLSCIVAVAQGV